MGDTSAGSDEVGVANSAFKRFDDNGVEGIERPVPGDLNGVTGDVGSSKPPLPQTNLLLGNSDNERPLVAVKTDFDLIGGRRSWFFSCCTCACCRVSNSLPANRTESAIEAIRSWDTKHCKSADDFLNLLEIVTKNAEETIQALRPLQDKLSFQDKEAMAAQKHSLVGGYMWLLTYGMNYVTMSPTEIPNSEERILHPNPRLNTRLMETHTAYEEIGELVQNWSLQCLAFLLRAQDLRKNGAQLVADVQGRFQFKLNPFQLIPKIKPPEVKPKTVDSKKIIQHITEIKLQKPLPPPHPKPILQRATISTRRSRAQSQIANVPEQHADLTRSPVVILVQATPGSQWEVFSALETPEKVELIAMFIQEPLKLLSSCFKSFKKAIMSADVIEQPGSERPSSIVELTCGLVHFTRSSRFGKMKFDASETTRLVESMKTFWITLDNLHETTLEISKLINEISNITACCYIYADAFYNWKLKKLDVEPEPKSVEEDRRIRKFMTRAAETTDIKDMTKLYILADFMSSGYQLTLQRNSVSSHGISIKLESWEDHKNEPWGLVDNMVDRRKPKGGSVKLTNKSRNFTMAYRHSL